MNYKKQLCMIFKSFAEVVHIFFITLKTQNKLIIVT